MDPLSITANLIAIITVCGKVTKTLRNFYSIYGSAAFVIASICTETGVISVSLTYIQSLIKRRPDAIMTRLRSRPELLDTLDTALTGCMLVCSCLENETQRLVSGAGETKAVSWGAKARLLWNQDTLKELLENIRGQQLALSLLIQALEMESLADIRELLQDHSKTLERIAHRTQSLRSSNRRISQLVPESILSASQTQNRPSEDRLASTIGSTEFDFDDEVVTARAYRSAFAAVQHKAPKMRTEPVQRDGGVAQIADVWSDEEPSLHKKRFVGMKCDACEELLEHKLQGERTWMTECEHIHHEKCFLLLNGQARTSCPSCPRVTRPSSGRSTIRGHVLG
jgi:hypothetical protein